MLRQPENAHIRIMNNSKSTAATHNAEWQWHCRQKRTNSSISC